MCPLNEEDVNALYENKLQVRLQSMAFMTVENQQQLYDVARAPNGIINLFTYVCM